MIRHLRNGCKNIAQIVGGINFEFAAAFHEAVDYGAGLARVGAAEEKEILFANGGGPDGIFDQIVVDLHLAVFRIDGQFRPPCKRVLDGFTQTALRKNLGQFLIKLTFDALQHRDGSQLADCCPVKIGRGAQLTFYSVEFPDVLHDAFGKSIWQGFMEIPPGMCPALDNQTPTYYNSTTGAEVVVLIKINGIRSESRLSWQSQEVTRK